MPDNKIVATLVTRVGIPLVYSVEVNKDETAADVELTAASASKLETLLGKDNLKFVRLKGGHVVYRIKLDVLEKAANEAQKVARGTGVEVEITSRIVYTITPKTEGMANDVGSAWWSADEMHGGIVVNGTEYEIVPGLAKDYYTQPSGEAGREWNPERTIYIVWLPATDKDGISRELQIMAYGVTNLIRSVTRRSERIG